MKNRITLFALFCLCFSISLADYTFKVPAPFVMNTEFLDIERHVPPPTFSDLPSLLQQNYRDDSKIKEFLQLMRKRLNDEKEYHKEILETQRALCKEEEDFRNQAVTEAEDALTRSDKQLGLCNSERERAVGFKDLADNALVVYRSDLAKLESNRKDEKALYDTRRERLVKAQEAIDTALNYIEEAEAQSSGLHPPAFIQLTNDLLKTSMRSGYSQMVLPVYSKLLQMSSLKDFNADDFQEIKDLLNKFKTNTLKAVEEMDDQEKKDKQRYDDSHEALTGLIEKLDKQSTDSQTAIESMESCVRQETSVNGLAKDKVTRNQDLLEKSQSLCQQTEKEYEAAERARNKQQIILNALDVALSKIIKENEDAQDVGSIIKLKTV